MSLDNIGQGARTLDPASPLTSIEQRGWDTSAWCSVEPWTVENGLITPTLKIKRAALEQRFAAQIEAIYAGGRR